jgi:excisionase family DNA binding protein
MAGPRNPSPLATRKVFTTGHVARLAGISLQTVIRCIDAGDLKGFKIPGGRDRRVTRANLLAWATAHGIELDWQPQEG